MSVRILAVDDIPANLKLLNARLRAEYFTVRTADSGLDAIQICQEEAIDLVLLDAKMPRLDGFETCKALKQNPRTRDIPIIMLSALNDTNSRIRGLECGADDFVSKPVNDIALVARINSLAGQKQLFEDFRSHSTTIFQEKDAERDVEPDQTSDGVEGDVLIVDDRPASGAMLVDQLRIEQNVETANSTDIALHKLKDRQWDAMVLNFNLALADPLAFLSQLKAHRQYRHLPTLAIIDPKSETRLQKGFLLGVTNYVKTPFMGEELRLRVQREVRRHRMLRKLRNDVESTLELAVTDPLTGLQNRRFLERQLVTLMDQSVRYERSLSIMLMDIDHFKSINDKHGHPTGDLVLKEFAHRIRRSLRGSDLACRYGGEEFVCVLSETTLEVAQRAAERLRQNIESEPFIINDKKEAIQVTASFGITQYLGKVDNVERMLKRADEALYKAKFAGRNQVIAKAA